MTKPAIAFIVARTRNHVIGKDNQIPWKISADLQFFKRVTMGHPIIMGRKTWDSIGRPLPGRRNLVVSRNRDLQLAGAEVVHSLEEALKQLADVPRVFIIGGEQLFKQAFAEADQLYLTEIDLEVAGDTFFEVPDPQNWQKVECVEGQEGEIRFRFLTLERKK